MSALDGSFKLQVYKSGLYAESTTALSPYISIPPVTSGIIIVFVSKLYTLSVISTFVYHFLN